jgi:hypothetical protein
MRHILFVVLLTAGCADSASQHDASSEADGKADGSRRFTCDRFQSALDSCIFEVVESRGDEAPPVDEEVIQFAFEDCVADTDWMDGIRQMECEEFGDRPPRWCTSSIEHFLGKTFIPCLTEIEKPTPDDFEWPE